jgi:hypothetical protein
MIRPFGSYGLNLSFKKMGLKSRSPKISSRSVGSSYLKILVRAPSLRSEPTRFSGDNMRFRFVAVLCGFYLILLIAPWRRPRNAIDAAPGKSNRSPSRTPMERNESSRSAIRLVPSLPAAVPTRSMDRPLRKRWRAKADATLPANRFHSNAALEEIAGTRAANFLAAFISKKCTDEQS